MFGRRRSHCWCSLSLNSESPSSAEFHLSTLCLRVVVERTVWSEMMESLWCWWFWLRQLRNSRSKPSTDNCLETELSGRSRSCSVPCYASTQFVESRSPTGSVCRRQRSCDCGSSESSRRCRRCGRCRSRRQSGPGVWGLLAMSSSTSHCRYTSLCHIHLQTCQTRVYCPFPYPVYHFR